MIKTNFLLTLLWSAMAVNAMAEPPTACPLAGGLASADQGMDTLKWTGLKGAHASASVNPCNGNFTLLVGAPEKFFVYNSQDYGNAWGLGYGWRYNVPSIEMSANAPATYVLGNGTRIALSADPSLGSGFYRASDRTRDLSHFDVSAGVIHQTLPGGTVIIDYMPRDSSGTVYQISRLKTVEGNTLKTWTWGSDKLLQSILDPNGAGYIFQNNPNSVIDVSAVGSANIFEADFGQESKNIFIFADQQTLILDYEFSTRLSNMTVNKKAVFGLMLGYGQLTRFDYPNGDQKTFIYSATDTLVQNKNGRQVKFKYQAGLITSVVEDTAVSTITRVNQDGNITKTVVDGAGQATSVSFNAKGELTQLRKPNGIILNHESYDAFHNFHSQTVIGAGPVQSYSYSYDASHRLASVTDPIGKIVYYQYNAWGLPTSVSSSGLGTSTFHYTNGTGGMPVYTGHTSTDRTGRLSASALSYLNSEGSIIGSVVSTNVHNVSVTSEFDTKGNLVRKTTPSAQTTFSYDDTNMLTQKSTIANNGKQLTSAIQKLDGPYMKVLTHSTNSKAFSIINSYSRESGQLTDQSINNVPTISSGKQLFR